jgi:quinoprotein glucose dehydrogenase
VGYAVTYVVSEAEIKDAVLKIGSDDQAKVYLNGKEVGKVAEARALEKDQNSFEGLTLNKGSNTLVFKVINEGADWSGCARFTDKEGKPLKSLKVDLKK